MATQNSYDLGELLGWGPDNQEERRLPSEESLPTDYYRAICSLQPKGSIRQVLTAYYFYYRSLSRTARAACVRKLMNRLHEDRSALEDWTKLRDILIRLLAEEWAAGENPFTSRRPSMQMLVDLLCHVLEHTHNASAVGVPLDSASVTTESDSVGEMSAREDLPQAM